MNEENLTLTLPVYGFIMDSFSSLEKAMKWAQEISKGRSLPDHFYEREEKKDVAEDRWPVDYSKPKTGLILAVVTSGMELGMQPMASLSMIIPIEGKMTLRGDAAKSMIFSSGKVKSWQEGEVGSIKDGDYKYTISSTRVNNITLAGQFGIAEAKRANLWVTQEKLNGPNGDRYRQSPWHRYPERMCMYRALGFLARDLYPDVIRHMILTEEARDYPDRSVMIIETPAGNVALTNTDGKAQRSDELNTKTTERVDDHHEKLGVEKSKDEAREAKKELDDLDKEAERYIKGSDPPKSDGIAALKEKTDGQVDFAQPIKEEPRIWNPVKTDEEVEQEIKKKEEAAKKKEPVKKNTNFTDRELLNMGQKIYDLARILTLDAFIDELPGKKTNKKYRTAILQWQDGLFHPEVKGSIPAAPDKPATGPMPPIPDDTTSHPPGDGQPEKKNTVPPEVSPEVEMAKGEQNYLGIEIPEIPSDQYNRDFKQARAIWLALADHNFDNSKYKQLAGRVFFNKEKHITYLMKFENLEVFLKTAPAVDINFLLNHINR